MRRLLVALGALAMGVAMLVEDGDRGARDRELSYWRKRALWLGREAHRSHENNRRLRRDNAALRREIEALRRGGAS